MNPCLVAMAMWPVAGNSDSSGAIYGDGPEVFLANSLRQIPSRKETVPWQRLSVAEMLELIVTS